MQGDAPQNTKLTYRWPTNEELAKAFPSQTLAQEMVAEKVREAEAAFAAGAEYVSLMLSGREVGRIYPDFRHWSPPPIHMRSLQMRATVWQAAEIERLRAALEAVRAEVVLTGHLGELVETALHG